MVNALLCGGGAAALRRGLLGLALAGTALLVACGGGSTPPADEGPAAGPPPAPPVAAGPLARIEISPPGGLIVGTSDRRVLTVRGFDANDRAVNIPEADLRVSSSSPSTIEVARVGTGYEVRALTAVGSALVSAQAGNISAKPVSFYAAEPVAGAVLVSDEQVRAAPVAVNPAARGALGWRYRVTLSGVGTPAAGAIMVGTGALPIAGRVVSSTPNASSTTNTDVVLELVGLPALFRNLDLKLQLTPEQTGALFVPNLAQASAIAPQTTLSKVNLSAVACSGDAPALSALSGELEVRVEQQLALDHQIRVNNGVLERLRLVASGSVTGSGKAVMNLGATVTGAVSCTLRIGAIPIPISGPLSALVAPLIPINFKAELGAQLQVNLFSVSAEIRQVASAEFGFDYQNTSEGGQLEAVKSLTIADPEFNRNVSFPTTASLRAKATLFAGLASGLDVGNALARLEAVELTAGPEFEAKFAGPADAASDSVYTTEYELKAKAAIGPGSDITALIELLLGSSRAIDLSLKAERSIAKSPAAASVSTEKSTFNAGDTVRFDVALNPQTINFPLVGYNVTEVRIYRMPLSAGGSAVQIGAVAPTADGQTEFQISWVADRAGTIEEAGRPNFFAFVVEKPLALITRIVPFELGAVQARDVGTQGLIAGGAGSIAVRANGTVVTWGVNTGDLLGRDGSSTLPGVVSLPGRAKAVAAGGWYGLSLLEDGRVFAWGWAANVADATGFGSSNLPTVDRPQPVGFDPGTRIVQIATRYTHSLALDSTGQPWGFGPSRWGQLGMRSTRGFVVQVPLTNIRAVAAGERHSLFLTQDGKVLCFGDNEFNQVASTGGTTPVFGLPKIKAIAASSFTSFALDEAGNVWSWGREDVLGRSGSTDPARIPGLSGVKAISAGNYNAFALMNDGTVRGWGDNLYGRVGIGGPGNGFVTVPTQLPVLSDVIEVNGAEFHGLALTRDGTIYTWGRNDQAALTGSTTPDRSTVPIISGVFR